MYIIISIIVLLSITAFLKIMLSDMLVNKRIYIREANGKKIDISAINNYSNSNTYKILFIGNSYTYFNDMPNIVKRLAESTGKEIIIGSFTKGGYSLFAHVNSDDEHSNQLKDILSYKWNVVVLQDQSLIPVTDADKFYSGVKTIASLINRDITRVLMYSTWTRKTDELSLEDAGMNREDLRVALSNSYIELANKIDAEICPVGEAFNNVKEGKEDINLYWFDGSHPSYKGSYISACVIYSVVFNESCQDLGYYGKILNQDKKVLQEYAKSAVDGISKES